MFTAATTSFLEGGCALVVGTVDDDGMPYATRGWGLRVVPVVPGVPATIRVLVAANDHVTLANLAGTGAVAITGADVPTLHSVQLKGRAVEIVADAGEGDRAAAHRYCEAFFHDIHVTEGTPYFLLERLRPVQYAACVVEVAQLYDQTPGPAAGGPIAASA